QAYGYHNPHDAIEVVNIRLTAWGRLKRPETAGSATSDETPSAMGARPVFFEADAPHEAQIYHRGDLRPGHRIAGPAVVEQLDTTTLVYPGDRARVDTALNLIIELAQ
ncbi:MAG: hypothetical protein VW835_22365, partial [Rickettsiales bacterium]